MQRALALARKKESLFTRYKMELLRQRTDDRLRPALAIEYGFKYFASMMPALILKLDHYNETVNSMVFFAINNIIDNRPILSKKNTTHIIFFQIQYQSHHIMRKFNQLSGHHSR